VCAASTGAAPAATHFDEVITVYLQQPIAVCGNAVCEPPSENSTNCSSDCHPGTWVRDISPNIEQGIVDQSFSSVKPLVAGMLAVGSDDSVVVAGTSAGTVNLGGDGGAFPPNAGVGLLAKYSHDGGFLWGTRFGTTSTGGPQLQQVNGVTVAPTGDVTVVGLAVDAQTMQYVWLSTYGGADGSGGTSITVPIGPTSSLPTLQLTREVAVDSQGNILLTGAFQGTATFGSTILTSSGPPTSIFVAKLAPQGAIRWAVMPSPPGPTSFPVSLAVDSADNLVMVTSDGVIDDQNLLKLSGIDGSMLQILPGFEGLKTVAVVDSQNNVYLSQSGNSTGVNGGIASVEILKCDPNLHILWTNNASTVCPQNTPNCVPVFTTNVQGAAIGFDQLGNVILGSFGDPAVGGGIDFTDRAATDAGFRTLSPFPTYHSNNIFLAAYSRDAGRVQWAKQIATILSSNLLGMAIDSKGRIIVSGNYSGSMLVDNQLLVTPVPQDPTVIDSFLASFGAPSPLLATPPTIGVASGPSGALVATVPQDIVAQATSPAGAVVFFLPPTAIDNGDPTQNAPPPGTSVFCSPAPNTMFPIGKTTVTCTASDPLGHQSTASFTVTVWDTLGPAFTPSTVADITVQATSASGIAVTFTPVATDAVDGPVTPVCKPQSGSVFPIGSSPVVCTATDKANSQTVAAFTVNVTPPPLTPPTVTCVGSQTSPAIVPVPQGVCGITVSNASAVAGTCVGGGDGGLASCTFGGQASETLGPGRYALAVLGTADDGSTAGCTSYVTVVDNQSPAIRCSDQTLECTGNSSATSTPTATCSDNCSCTARCTSATFPLGTTRGSCSATDPSGNMALCKPNVTVVDTKPPSINVSVSPSVLWPPNHKLVAIAITDPAKDACDSKPTVTCTATSNEPDSGGGSGHTLNDIQWNNGQLYLRAERSGKSSGRIYTISCVATDVSGNRATATATVTVPHDR
jgi:hypothetical protein